MTTMATTPELAEQKAAAAEQRKRAEKWNPDGDKAVASAVRQRDRLRERLGKLTGELDAQEAAAEQRRAQRIEALVAGDNSIDVDADPEDDRKLSKIRKRMDDTRAALEAADARIESARADARDRLLAKFKTEYRAALEAALSKAEQFLESHAAMVQLQRDAEGLGAHFRHGSESRFTKAETLAYWIKEGRDGDLDAR